MATPSRGRWSPRGEPLRIADHKTQKELVISLVKLGHELAAEMGVDETELCDELILVAGRVPSDISQALLDKPEMLRSLRSKQ